MRTKHKRVLLAVFQEPVLSSIVWKDIEKMLLALGADVEEAKGSRITVVLNNTVAVFHRPHPRKETDKGAVKALRNFLNEAGIQSC